MSCAVTEDDFLQRVCDNEDYGGVRRLGNVSEEKAPHIRVSKAKKQKEGYKQEAEANLFTTSRNDADSFAELGNNDDSSSDAESDPDKSSSEEELKISKVSNAIDIKIRIGNVSNAIDTKIKTIGHGPEYDITLKYKLFFNFKSLVETIWQQPYNTQDAITASTFKLKRCEWTSSDGDGPTIFRIRYHGILGKKSPTDGGPLGYDGSPPIQIKYSMDANANREESCDVQIT
ncbi:hypothetical protein BOTCAL_0084g00330 [Botryotinia calthae]|uniref:Uncharacterized protein n=1 Tax=Botryotinia calthae TaxID=38488 RepID=A0A4Y8DA67_9HELO|nr:hypothetical protein BOTCAL_0084g00330 [Botryotinia calthae]